MIIYLKYKFQENVTAFNNFDKFLLPDHWQRRGKNFYKIDEGNLS